MKRILIFGGTAFLVAFVVAFLMSFLPFPNESKTLLPIVFGVLIAFAVTSMSGNKKVVKVGADERARSLSALPPNGQAVAWVYREGFVGKAVGINVSLDSQDVAQLKSPACTRILLTAGTHTLGASFSGIGGMSPNPASAPVDVKGGETLVFKLTMKMGAVKNTLLLEPQTDVAGTLQRLASTPMVQPLAAAG